MYVTISEIKAKHQLTEKYALAELENGRSAEPLCTLCCFFLHHLLEFGAALRHIRVRRIRGGEGDTIGGDGAFLRRVRLLLLCAGLKVRK